MSSPQFVDSESEVLRTLVINKGDFLLFLTIYKRFDSFRPGVSLRVLGRLTWEYDPCTDPYTTVVWVHPRVVHEGGTVGPPLSWFHWKVYTGLDFVAHGGLRTRSTLKPKHYSFTTKESVLLTYSKGRRNRRNICCVRKTVTSVYMRVERHFYSFDGHCEVLTAKVMDGGGGFCNKVSLGSISRFNGIKVS